MKYRRRTNTGRGRFLISIWQSCCAGWLASKGAVAFLKQKLCQSFIYVTRQGCQLQQNVLHYSPPPRVPFIYIVIAKREQDLFPAPHLKTNCRRYFFFYPAAAAGEPLSPGRHRCSGTHNSCKKLQHENILLSLG